MEKLNIKINAKKNYAEIFINDKEQKKFVIMQYINVQEEYLK